MFNYESVGGPTNSDIHHSPVSASLCQGEGENHSAQNRRLSTLNSRVPSYIHFNPTANRIDHQSAKMHTCKNAKFKGSMSVRVWKSTICKVFMFDIVNSQFEQVSNKKKFHKPSMNHQRVNIMQNRKASVALLISSSPDIAQVCYKRQFAATVWFLQAVARCCNNAGALMDRLI